MNDFDVDKPLPSVITIKCVENHLSEETSENHNFISLKVYLMAK
jgi:hypothetical protein